MENSKKLVIAPHADDEVLGCGGILENNSCVYICSINEEDFGLNMAERERELADAAGFLNYHCIIEDSTKVNQMTVSQMVPLIEETMNVVRPEYIFIPHPGYNQDHTTVYYASIAALRPHDINYFVPKILVYESIHDFVWSHNQFNPNFFVPIDITKKIRAFSFYKSQMRGHRSVETIKQLAAMRGAMSNLQYAEAYQILRWVA